MQPIYLYRNEVETGDVRVDRFPEVPRALATITILTANFVGTVTVEATIKLEPTGSDWFVIHTETFPTFVTQEEKKRNRAVNVAGRFISMRATVTKDEGHPFGIVDRVTVI